MRLNSIATMIAVLAGFNAATGRAETILIPYAGVAIPSDSDERPLTFGGALAFMDQDGGLGFEIDGGYTSDFFGDPAVLGSENNAATLMGNILLAIPLGDQAKLYGAGGGGLLRTRIDEGDFFDDITRNDFGINVGGGVLLSFGDQFGVRGDVRYFRDLTDDEDDFPELGGFHFWRVTGGLAVKF
jgi:opacity protein-like surface antigen